MSPVLNDKLSLSSLTVTSTGAAKANIQLIADGEADLAIVQNDVMDYANTGTDLFEAEGNYDSVSAVCGMYDETVQLITTDADIKTVADLDVYKRQEPRRAARARFSSTFMVAAVPVMGAWNTRPR